jgi:hypothetical protein
VRTGGKNSALTGKNFPLTGKKHAPAKKEGETKVCAVKRRPDLLPVAF